MGYETSSVAVDPVIFTIMGGSLMVLLNKREKEPFLGKNELPGGLLLKDETAEEAVYRKLKSLLSTSKIFFKQFCTFTDPKRDPRGRTVSIGFVALVSDDYISAKENWHAMNSLPELAFDHREIIKSAYKYLRENLGSEIVRYFLPEKFPLNKLQEIHETIKKEKYDNRNFRKMMISSGVVIETKERESNVSHRPAYLYRFR